jgi:hypothetical protein
MFKKSLLGLVSAALVYTFCSFAPALESGSQSGIINETKLSRLLKNGADSARRHANILNWDLGLNYFKDEREINSSNDSDKLLSYLDRRVETAENKLERLKREMDEEGKDKDYYALFAAYLGHKTVSNCISGVNALTSNIKMGKGYTLDARLNLDLPKGVKHSDIQAFAEAKPNFRFSLRSKRWPGLEGAVRANGEGNLQLSFPVVQNIAINVGKKVRYDDSNSEFVFGDDMILSFRKIDDKRTKILQLICPQKIKLGDGRYGVSYLIAGENILYLESGERTGGSFTTKLSGAPITLSIFGDSAGDFDKISIGYRKKF